MASGAFVNERAADVEAKSAHKGGPEGVNPFWQDPANAAKNVEEAEGALEKYEDTLADNEQLVFALAKSDSKNLAVFVLDKSKPVDDEDAIKTSWLLVDKKHRDAHLKKQGVERDDGRIICLPLNALERAYLGCSVEADDDGKRIVEIAAFEEANLEFTPEVEIVRTQGDYWLRSENAIPGKVCRVERAYVQMCKGTTRRVDSLFVYGTDMEGEEVSRRIMNGEVI